MLIIFQTIFYIVSSIAIIVIGVMLGILIYYLICIFKNTRNISNDLNKMLDKIKKSIIRVINSFSKKKK
jgi:hypothetical protein